MWAIFLYFGTVYHYAKFRCVSVGVSVGELWRYAFLNSGWQSSAMLDFTYLRTKWHLNPLATWAENWG